MFDLAARQHLDEMLGYERYVLCECGDAIRTQQGRTGPVRLEINDSASHTIHLSISDTLGDIGAGMVRKMSPLVFTASLKLIDMVFEWTITENGISCPFQFERKIGIIDTTSTLQYPDYLGSDSVLRATTIALYKALVPYRNAIIHNLWGQAKEGALDFDFTRKGTHYKKLVPFDEVLALADSAELLGSTLVHQSADQYKLDSLRFLFNKLASFHGQTPFAITEPRYFQVIRRTTMPPTGHLTVDLAEIRSFVAQQSFGKTATFDLLVAADTSPRPNVWKVPFSDIPAAATVMLDEAWDRFRTDAAEELNGL
jgi:hypothetical protein